MVARHTNYTPLQELYEVIENNAYPFVKSYLDNGSDPNVNLASWVMQQDESELITLCSDGTLLEGILSPLYVAVVDCYYTFRGCSRLLLHFFP
jgi:hypothetical protein